MVPSAMDSFRTDHTLSIELVWVDPLTYFPALWVMVSWWKRLKIVASL